MKSSRFINNKIITLLRMSNIPITIICSIAMSIVIYHIANKSQSVVELDRLIRILEFIGKILLINLILSFCNLLITIYEKYAGKK
jgi:hypothetical protein